MFRIAAEGLVEVGKRLQQIALFPVAQAAIDIGIDVLRIEAERLVVVADRTVEFDRGSGPDARSAAVGVRGVRIEADGLAVVGDGRVELAFPLVELTAAVVRPGEIRLEADGLVAIRNALVVLVLVSIGQPALAERLGTFRIEADGLGIAVDGSLIIAVDAGRVALPACGIDDQRM